MRRMRDLGGHELQQRQEVNVQRAGAVGKDFAYISQTIIGISNNMRFATKAAINNSIGRRVVEYKMDKELGKLRPSPHGTVDAYIKMQFIASCLSVSAAYERVPMP